MKKDLRCSLKTGIAIYISDATENEILRVKIRGKSFSFNPIEEEHIACPTKYDVTELWHKRLVLVIFKGRRE